MSGAYIRAIQNALGSFLSLVVKLALPLAIVFGLALVAAAVAYLFRKDESKESLDVLRRSVGRLAGFGLVGLMFVVCWAALSQARAIAVDAFNWKDAAEEVANPTEDAPSVRQFGPVAAILKDNTFTRTIALPVDIGKRIQDEGVELLAPYLQESSATELLGQAERLELKGSRYFLTREVKRKEEAPIAFQISKVSATFKDLGDRAYSMHFEGAYGFKNPDNVVQTVRFTFSPPEAGTIGDLKLEVDGQVVGMASDGNYEWSGTLQPNESKTAKVAYDVVGSKTWSYDVGSRRRQVEDFQLSVQSPSALKFVRGSIQPTVAGQNPRWKLSNVVTNQQVAISFPSDQIGRETFLQTIAMLPAAMALFALGLTIVSWRCGFRIDPVRHAVSIGLFTFGLAGASVMANYLGNIGGVLASFAFGIGASAALLGKKGLLASIPAALFAASFLSAEHTGLLVVVLALATMAAYWLLGGKASANL